MKKYTNPSKINHHKSFTQIKNHNQNQKTKSKHYTNKFNTIRNLHKNIKTQQSQQNSFDLNHSVNYIKKNPLNINSSILNITISSTAKQNNEIQKIMNSFDIQQYEVNKNEKQDEQLLVDGLQQKKQIDVEQERIKELNVKCECGCNNLNEFNVQVLLKKKWNKYYSETIFDYFFKDKNYYDRISLKQKIRRFFISNNLIFRLQEIQLFLNQLYHTNQIPHSIVCYRKFAIILQTFTQSNHNQIYRQYHICLHKYNTHSLCFNQIKMEILHATTRTFYQKFKLSVQNLKLLFYNQSDQFIYWDLYKLKQTNQCQTFIDILKEYNQSHNLQQ